MIAAHVPNLMDRSRFGSGVRFVNSASEAVDDRLIIVDLDRCSDLVSFAELSGHTIGFCAHVDSERMATAAAAGFDEVMARSAFFRGLSDLLVEGGGETETG